jgi:acyl-coenzyme A synthetase/AMP-(fatty) acid ligase
MVRSFNGRKALSPPKAKLLTTTCFFHVGGFISPLNSMTNEMSFVFNHGPDLEKEHPTELLYKEVDCWKPYLMMCGSHHLVLLSQTGPKDKKLSLASVTLVMPLGSTVPTTLYDDLKTNFQSLRVVYSIYGMTEVGLTMARTFDLKTLGAVGTGCTIKLEDPEAGTLCGPNEVS